MTEKSIIKTLINILQNFISTESEYSTSIIGPCLSLFISRHRIVPSATKLLNSSSEAFTGRFKLGRVLFSHSITHVLVLAIYISAQKTKNHLKEQKTKPTFTYMFSFKCKMQNNFTGIIK